MYIYKYSPGLFRSLPSDPSTSLLPAQFTQAEAYSKPFNHFAMVAQFQYVTVHTYSILQHHWTLSIYRNDCIISLNIQLQNEQVTKSDPSTSRNGSYMLSVSESDLTPGYTYRIHPYYEWPRCWAWALLPHLGKCKDGKDLHWHKRSTDTATDRAEISRAAGGTRNDPLKES